MQLGMPWSPAGRASPSPGIRAAVRARPGRRAGIPSSRRGQKARRAGSNSALGRNLQRRQTMAGSPSRDGSKPQPASLSHGSSGRIRGRVGRPSRSGRMARAHRQRPGRGAEEEVGEGVARLGKEQRATSPGPGSRAAVAGGRPGRRARAAIVPTPGSRVAVAGARPGRRAQTARAPTRVPTAQPSSPASSSGALALAPPSLLLWRRQHSSLSHANSQQPRKPHMHSPCA